MQTARWRFEFGLPWSRFCLVYLVAVAYKVQKQVEIPMRRLRIHDSLMPLSICRIEGCCRQMETGCIWGAPEHTSVK